MTSSWTRFRPYR